MIRIASCAACCAAALSMTTVSFPAHAHVTLEQQRATAGGYYKAVLRVPHGCKNSPTTAVRVRIPDGVTGVKPQPKPGWKVEIVREALDPPVVDRHGHTVTERVASIHWTGGRLLDEHYDEFVMRVRLPDTPGQTIYFPTVQDCEVGVHRWIEIPAEGRSRSDYDEPAPQLTLTPRN